MDIATSSDLMILLPPYHVLSGATTNILPGDNPSLPIFQLLQFL